MSAPPPPPPGSIPPPPPGAMPPPPMGSPGAPGTQPQVGAAFSWAVSKFGQNLGVLLSFAAIIFVIQGVGQLITDALVTDDPNNVAVAFGGLGLSLVLSVLLWVLSTLATIGLVNSGLTLTRGEKPQFSDLWTPTYFWQYIGVSILFGLATGFGLLLCIIPGLFVLWAWQFAQYAAIDSGPGVFASFGESWRMVSANKGVAVITVLVVFAANAVLLIIPFGVGALISAPFVALFMSHMYRQFRNQPIAA